MKKTFLIFAALVVNLGSVISGCRVDRGYYRLHHQYYYEHHYKGEPGM